jgi:hypothetical protein
MGTLHHQPGGFNGYFMAYFINEKRWFFMGFLGDLMGYLW